jgi:AAHS family 4-hydroxybenzoate transporter-like MFS transporter
LSDIYGLKRAILLGAFWTGLFIFSSAFMPNIAALAALRAISALGHAASCPAMTGVIGRYLPRGRPRTLAYSVLAGSGAIGSGLGWLVGGLLGSVR